MTARALLAALLLAALAAGCAIDDTATPDTAAASPTPAGTEDDWRDAVNERLGFQMPDRQWERFTELAYRECDRHEDDVDDWTLALSVGADEGIPVADTLQDVSYACPEHLDVARQAAEQVQR